MWFVLIGVILLLCKISEIGPVGQWSWFVIATPFVLAVAFWFWADQTGYYQRRSMEKMDQKRRDRRSKNMEALGLDPNKKRRS